MSTSTKLAACEDVEAQACPQHALDAGTRIMRLARQILAGDNVPQASPAKHPQRPSLHQKAPRMPEDPQR